MKTDAYAAADGIKQLLDEEGAVFTFGGVDYPCIVSDLDESKDLGFGGFALKNGKRVVFLNESLNGVTAPAAKDAITVSGKSLEVDSVLTSPDGSFYDMTLSDPTMGV